MLNKHFALTLVFSLLAALGCTKEQALDVASKPPERDTEQNNWLIRARVVSGAGGHITNAEVATFWSANGVQWDEEGVFHKVKTEADAAEYWNDEGQMEPYPSLRGTLSNEEFTIKKTKRKPYIVLAINDDRTHGGLAAASPASQEPITIQLKQLTRVFGTIRCNGDVPGWTNAYVYAPGLIKELPD